MKTNQKKGILIELSKKNGKRGPPVWGVNLLPESMCTSNTITTITSLVVNTRTCIRVAIDFTYFTKYNS